MTTIAPDDVDYVPTLFVEHTGDSNSSYAGQGQLQREPGGVNDQAILAHASTPNQDVEMLESIDVCIILGV